jgi:hypothetical protein
VNGSRPQAKVKSFDIPKSMVWEAFQRVKANKGAPGADGVTIEQYEQNLSGNLFKLWNRMVRREALRCIPGAAGRNSEGSFWVTQPT